MIRHHYKSMYRELIKAHIPCFFRVVLCLILMFVILLPGTTQELLHWRTWKDPDTPLGGNTGWIYISPNNRIWLGQNRRIGKVISWYDGYKAGSIPLVTKALTVREGHFGQIWALDINFITGNSQVLCKGVGLGQYVYKHSVSKGKWNYFPLSKPPLQNLPIIPFTGVENVFPSIGDSVLILLPNQLIETTPINGRTIILKRSDEANLGCFIHMRESQDGGLWLTAEHGLAKVEGIFADNKWNYHSMEWETWSFPPELELQDLAIPFETRKGEIFGTALSRKDGRRHLVRFENTVWEIIPTTDTEEIVMGWRGIDDMIWILKAESIVKPQVPLGYYGFDKGNWISPTLWCIKNGEERAVMREFESSSYIWHIGVESNGPFWLGHERGITRYAPPTWRVPSELGELRKPVFAAHKDNQGRLWFLDSDSLLCFEQEKWRQIPNPRNRAV